MTHASAPNDREVAMPAIIRTYETVTIVWDRGSRWSGGMTRADAERTLAFAAERGEFGHIEVTPWEVEIPADKVHLFQPGVAERVA